jgi:hypothetical protein
MKDSTFSILVLIIILAISIGGGCAFAFTMQDKYVDWSFTVPSYGGATKISTDHDGGFLYPFHDMPYNITGHGLIGQTVRLQVWYYKESTVSGENIGGTPILIDKKEYAFTVIKP